MKNGIIYLLMSGLSAQLLVSSCKKEALNPKSLNTEGLQTRTADKQYNNGSSSDPATMILDRTFYPLPKPDVDPTADPDPEPDPWRKK